MLKRVLLQRARLRRPSKLKKVFSHFLKKCCNFQLKKKTAALKKYKLAMETDEKNEKLAENEVEKAKKAYEAEKGI